MTSLSENLIFIYDGECPFCKKFAELLELKSNLPNIEIKDARKNIDDVPEGYDMDVKGALLIKGTEMLSGSNAINYICSKIKSPSSSLLKLLTAIFLSNKRTELIFPILLRARRILLFSKRVPRKLNQN